MPTVGLRTLSTFDEEDITVSAAAGGVALSNSLYLVTPPASAATITVETAQIRWTKASDRNLAQGSRGNVANVGAVIFLDSLQDIVSFRAIRTGGTSATIHIEYHR